MHTCMKNKKKMSIIIISIIAVIGILALIILNLPVFGGKPSGARLERMKQSPNYKNGQFQNQIPTPMMIEDENGEKFNIINFLFGDKSNLQPPKPLNMVKRDLKRLPKDKDLYIWFGHSSYILSLHGTVILVDPTLLSSSPVPFFNKPFEGTEVYKPEDLPDRIDYLVISHDHYDHLDYETVKRIKDKVVNVVCPLGVGAHFERWGYDADKLIEMDWYEDYKTPDSITIHCLPARHFSGRMLNRNNTLWASFLFETSKNKIFIGGDSGYGPHFKEIGKTYPDIDLAILENGQYNKQWQYIHTLPDQLGKEAVELNAKQIITVHHSKYALAYHSWDEPLKNEISARDKYNLNLLIFQLGEVNELNLNQ